jgi:hypothetical protein
VPPVRERVEKGPCEERSRAPMTATIVRPPPCDAGEQFSGPTKARPLIRMSGKGAMLGHCSDSTANFVSPVALRPTTTTIARQEVEATRTSTGLEDEEVWVHTMSGRRRSRSTIPR